MKMKGVIKRKTALAGMAFAALVLFNLFQVVSNSRLRKSLDMLQAAMHAQEYDFAVHRIQQSLVGGVLRDVNLETRYKGEQFSVSQIVQKTKLSILFLFSSTDCANCVRAEVDELNKLPARVPAKQAQVAGIGFSETVDSTFLFYSFGVKPLFPVYRSKADSLVISSSRQPTPLVLLVDNRGEILAAYVAEALNAAKREKFYKFIRIVLS